MNKTYVSAGQLLEDSFQLGWRVYESGFRPDFIVGVWRGGAPVGIAVHELLKFLGVESDHIAIRTAFYEGVDQRAATVRVDGLEYLLNRLAAQHTLLIVDDVHDTGLSIDQAIRDITSACGENTPEIRIATPYFKPGRCRTGRVPDYYLHQTENWLVFPHEIEGLSLEEIADNKPELASILDALSRVVKQGE